MNKLLFLLGCIPWASAQSQDYWQQEVNYSIDVTLTDSTHCLDGLVSINYVNRSPDTLAFIWVHLWANAYKNDRTAFSDQLLENGRTDFYYSRKEDRGYINSLDFRVNGVAATTRSDPSRIDVVQIILPHPLLPGQALVLNTPFHEQLPYDFAGSGYNDHEYEITDWYPEPAVYDRNGWHPYAMLSQEGGYHEFGKYDVRIVVPEKFQVAAPGVWSTQPRVPEGNPTTKTIHCSGDNMPGLAWFASQNFKVGSDSLQLASGRYLPIHHFYLADAKVEASKTMLQVKEIISYYDSLIGGYPYPDLSVIETSGNWINLKTFSSLIVCKPHGPISISTQIRNQIGGNWFANMVGPDGRRFPWMALGIPAYYGNRYRSIVKLAVPMVTRRHPQYLPCIRRDNNEFSENLNSLLLQSEELQKTDQPIASSSADFSLINYHLIAQYKAAMWLSELETNLGRPLFDSCIKNYFRAWQFRHPGPSDLKNIILESGGPRYALYFEQLNHQGPIPTETPRKKNRISFLFSEPNPQKYNVINVSPVAGYNLYDRFMAGVAINNYHLPLTHFQFFIAPLYATASKQCNGIADTRYRWYGDRTIHEIDAGISAARFSTSSGVDSNGHMLYGGFYKIVPSFRLVFKNRSPRSTAIKAMEWKTYLIGEKNFSYRQKSSDSLYYPVEQTYQSRYLNQLAFTMTDGRILYPYSARLELQQAKQFYRFNLTGTYFFNYVQGGGMHIRVFAAKFGYLGDKTLSSQFSASNYQPKLTAIRGNEDYTYNNYFIGRNEFDGFASQQIMLRDGDLKLRTDLFQGLQGRSEHWVAAINVSSPLPYSVIPAWIPLQVFLDVGTYAEAWSSNPPTSKFLYVAGLQLSLLKDCIHIFAPIFYSRDFSNNLKTVPQQNTFGKKISFSLDFQHLHMMTMNTYRPLL